LSAVQAPAGLVALESGLARGEAHFGQGVPRPAVSGVASGDLVSPTGGAEPSTGQKPLHLRHRPADIAHPVPNFAHRVADFAHQVMSSAQPPVDSGLLPLLTDQRDLLPCHVLAASEQTEPASHHPTCRRGAIRPAPIPPQSRS
jgi:hypothetical protein